MRERLDRTLERLESSLGVDLGGRRASFWEDGKGWCMKNPRCDASVLPESCKMRR